MGYLWKIYLIHIILLVKTAFFLSIIYISFKQVKALNCAFVRWFLTHTNVSFCASLSISPLSPHDSSSICPCFQTIIKTTLSKLLNLEFSCLAQLNEPVTKEGKHSLNQMHSKSSSWSLTSNYCWRPSLNWDNCMQQKRKWVMATVKQSSHGFGTTLHCKKFVSH